MPFIVPAKGPAHASWRLATVNRTPAKFNAEYVIRSAPNSALSKERSMRVNAAAPIQTVRLAVRRKGHNRSRMAVAFPPTSACHTFVTNEGASSSAIAVGKSNMAVKGAKLTVGRPSPSHP